MQELYASLNFRDQYTFRPTSSTPAAHISLLQAVADLISNNRFVAVTGLDFGKAFDTIHNATHVDKMAQLQISDVVYNGLVDLFDGHEHCTKFRGTR